MRRGLMKALGIAVAVTLLAAAPAHAAFGLKDFSFAIENEDGTVTQQAGSHPFQINTTFNVNTVEDSKSTKIFPDKDVKELHFELPAGLIGSLAAVPRCSAVDFLTVVEEFPMCPDATAVGAIQSQLPNPDTFIDSPVYNLVPPPGVAVKLGFLPKAIRSPRPTANCARSGSATPAPPKCPSSPCPAPAPVRSR